METGNGEVRALDASSPKKFWFLGQAGYRHLRPDDPTDEAYIWEV
jgi:hypothetical protein